MLKFRKAVSGDCITYFEWANDEFVRMQSFNSEIISLENHLEWFNLKISDNSCLMLIFQNEKDQNIGQVRIQNQENNEAIIGISVSSEIRGKGYATEILKLAIAYFFKQNKQVSINAYIKEQNLSSKYVFEKAGFQFIKMVNYESHKSYHYKISL